MNLLSKHSANKLNPLSQHSANGRVSPTRIELPQTQSQRMESFVLIGGPTITQESILRSRIAELEAQVENLKAKLNEARQAIITQAAQAAKR